MSGRDRRRENDVLSDAQANSLAFLDGHEREAEQAHALALAAEHCLAMRDAIYELPEPFLRRMSDMLLLEIGRAIAQAERAEKRRQMT